MLKYLIGFFLVIGSSLASVAQNDSAFIRKIYDEALENGEAYENLRYLCKNIGHRLAGSAEAEMAVFWSKQLMETYGFDRVYLQKIEVPHWERGTEETAWILTQDGKIEKLNILALGGSVGTNGLLEAEVVFVADMETLTEMPEADINGKVVYLAKAFDQKFINTGKAYGACGSQRWNGASAASQKGAVGVVIRSLGVALDDHPHTGSMSYGEGDNKIPAAAISTVDCGKLEAALEKGSVKLRMELDCRWYENVTSYNVIAELNGEQPNQIITIGGHLDSWDVGEGAHDDGAGVMHSLEALRILKKLGHKPKHTLRCVFFMNEENGNFGGKGYAEYAQQNKENHIAAIESDRGGFLPLGFDVSGSNGQLDFIQMLSNPLQKDFELYRFKNGYGGVDISPLKQYYPNMLQLGLNVNTQEYFKYHHTEADVFETVDKRELHLGCAAMAAMLYLVDTSLEVVEIEE